MRKGNDIPLHKRIHYRRVREAIAEIAEYEGISPSNYDMERMTVYETVGENLKGNNVTYNISNGRSCWVYDNWYDFVEVPSVLNKPGSPYGDFLFFAYNSSFQYHLFGKMRVILDEAGTRLRGVPEEEVHVKNYGKYSIIFGSGSSGNRITKVEYGSYFDPGASSDEHNFSFDSYNSRKMAYKTDAYKILRSVGVKGNDPHKISGDKPVKIYSSSKKKTTRGKKPASASKRKAYDKRFH